MTMPSKTSIDGLQTVVDGIRELQSTAKSIQKLNLVPWPTALPQGSGFWSFLFKWKKKSYDCVLHKATENRFEPMSYFDVCPHLTMEDGYKLDYAYRKYNTSGYPQVFAMRYGEVPSIEDLEMYFSMRRDDDTSRPLQFLSHIKTDGSPNAYAELVLLKILANKFSLWWHSLYGILNPICDEINAEKILGELKENGVAEVGSIKFNDLKPHVIFKDNNVVIVDLVYYSAWEGLVRLYTSLSIDFPHRILDERTTVLAPYDCDIRF